MVSIILCLLILGTLGSGDTQRDRLKALNFADNKDSYITFVPDSAFSQISRKASVCAWLKNPGASNYSTVFTYHGNNFMLAGRGLDNKVADSGWFPRSPVSSVTAVLAEWHHVCLTFSTSPGRARYYVNGEEVASTSTRGTIRYSSSYKVTVGNFEPGYPNGYYGGEVTDLNVYAKTLSGEEVQEMYKAGVFSLEADRNEETKVLSWGEILKQPRSGSVTETMPTICDETELKENITTLSRTIEELRNQIISLNQTNEDLVDQVTIQNQTVKDLSDQATDLKETNKELEDTVTTQNKNIEDLRDHVSTLKENNEHLIEEVTTLRQCQRKRCKARKGGKKKGLPEALEE